MLAISYEDGRQPKENNQQDSAAIDLGEIHEIACFADNGPLVFCSGILPISWLQLRHALSVTGRKMFPVELSGTIVAIPNTGIFTVLKTS